MLEKNKFIASNIRYKKLTLKLLLQFTYVLNKLPIQRRKVRGGLKAQKEASADPFFGTIVLIMVEAVDSPPRGVEAGVVSDLGWTLSGLGLRSNQMTR